jgi:DedD protein
MKQRLVGTLVLGALALILIPLLLDGEGVKQPAAIAITPPPPPVIDTTPIPTPQRPIILADQPAAPGAEGIEAPAEESAAAEPAAAVPPVIAEQVDSPRLDEQGLPESWSVRLGTFGDRRNAEALLASLLLENYKAYLRPIETPQGTLSAVYVGPVLTRADANRLQQELAAGFELDGIVTRFEIAPMQ